ncbi:hypothetical protein [Mycobacterium sp. AZCC_0083]|uniref:hypothetical protein n=1 Tax=Mycobacterium sp. AZCC_0083 TaxID=2735882 RepID=UPI0016105F6D|nr:hypothetical protein [Mycobacterium sp. AZCC_0083]MBB5167119.1 hypothetical protein [Mycobacterium sp. AZCC_0083]
MTKVLMLLSVLCLTAGVFELAVSIGLWGQTWPPDWFFYVLGGSWAGAVGFGAAGMVLDE